MYFFIILTKIVIFCKTLNWRIHLIKGVKSSLEVGLEVQLLDIASQFWASIPRFKPNQTYGDYFEGSNPNLSS